MDRLSWSYKRYVTKDGFGMWVEEDLYKDPLWPSFCKHMGLKEDTNETDRS